MMAASLMPMEPLMPIQMSASKNTIYIALELSNSTWLVAARIPEAEKVVVHRMDAGDTTALLAFVATQRARARAWLGGEVEVVSCFEAGRDGFRSEEHTSELQSLMRISYAVFCFKKKNEYTN